jgi:hypothetical protein
MYSYICLGEKLGLYSESQKSAPPSLLVSFDAWYEKLMFVFIQNVTFYYHNNHDLCPFAVSLALYLCVYSFRIPLLPCFSSWFLKFVFRPPFTISLFFVSSTSALPTYSFDVTSVSIVDSGTLHSSKSACIFWRYSLQRNICITLHFSEAEIWIWLQVRATNSGNL